jgi:hypothetical protein
VESGIVQSLGRPDQRRDHDGYYNAKGNLEEAVKRRDPWMHWVTDEHDDGYGDTR